MRETLKPCDYFAEPYTLEWKQSVLQSGLGYQEAGQCTEAGNCQLYVRDQHEVEHSVDANYRLEHAFKLAAKHDFSVIVRARLDQESPKVMKGGHPRHSRALERVCES
jgi:hypothetical protein